MTRTDVRHWLRVLLAVVILGGAMLSFALPAKRTAPGAWETSAALALPLRGFEGLSVTIVTDIGVIAPELSGQGLSDEALVQHFASGVPRALEPFRTQLHKTDFSHAVPYIYAAVYHSLGRIHHALSLDVLTLADGKPLLPRAPIRSGALTIRVTGSRRTFDEYASRAVGVSSIAYWDPARHEVGIYRDRSELSWLKTYRGWLPSEPRQKVLAIERYLTTLLMERAAHELFHAVQAQTNDIEYRIPLIKEGAAVYATTNVYDREEMVRLIEVDISLNADRRARVSEQQSEECLNNDAVKGTDGYATIATMNDAARAIKAEPTLSLTGLLNPKSFYVADRSKMSERYAVAFSAMEYLLHANQDSVLTWRRAVKQVYETGKVPSGSDMNELDRKYRSWMDKWASVRSSAHPQAADRYRQAARASDLCVKALMFSQARWAALRMIASRPESPVGLVYLGDIFWKLQQPISALEYYTAAAATEAHGVPDEVRGRVQSRMADAYEQLGRVDDAIEIWRQTAQTKPASHDEAAMQCRGLLKADFYESIRGTPLWGKNDSLFKFQTYLKTLVQRTQNATTLKEFRDAYQLTRTEMLADLRLTPAVPTGAHPAK